MIILLYIDRCALNKPHITSKFINLPINIIPVNTPVVIIVMNIYIVPITVYLTCLYKSLALSKVQFNDPL